MVDQTKHKIEHIGEIAKALIALVPGVAAGIIALVNALADAGITPPAWLVTVVAVATAFAVYAVPNSSPSNPPEQADSDTAP